MRKLTHDMMEQEDEYLSMKSKEKNKGSCYLLKNYNSADKTSKLDNNKNNNGTGTQ